MFKLSHLLPRCQALIAGLELAGTHIRLIEISGKDQQQLERYGCMRLPFGTLNDDGIDDLERLIESVQALRDSCGALSRRIAIGIPTAMTITAARLLPVGTDTDDEEQLEALARAQVAELLPFPAEQASIDFRVLAPALPDSQPSLFIAAVHQEVIDDLLAMSEALDLEVTAVDIASYADYAACIRTNAQLKTAVADAGETVAILRFDDSLVHCALFDNTGLIGGALYCEPLTSGSDQTATTLLRRALAQTSSTRLREIVVSGVHANFPGLRKTLQQQLRTNTIIAAPFDGMTCAAGIDATHLHTQAPAYLTACGVALRSSMRIPEVTATARASR